jgi:spore photoproduct lyase
LWSFLKHVPDNYTYPDSIWYALIRWLNCQWKCSYCYLQSYYKSPDLVKYSNFSDFIFFLEKFIIKFIEKYWINKKLVLFDWDFYDSFWFFWLKNSIDEINQIINLIEKFNNVYLEIRSKCIINWDFEINYWDLKISNKVIYAVTFSPKKIIDKYENWTSSLITRIDYWNYIIQKWWKIWIRIDPIIFDEHNLYDTISIYSVLNTLLIQQFNWNYYNFSVWVLRLKDSLYKKLLKSNSTLVSNLQLDNWFYRYNENIRNKLYNIFLQNDNMFICMD